MSGVVSFAATGVLIALGVWLFGGFVLRAGGAILALGGLLTAASTMALAAIICMIAWLAGHWLYALRHHYFSAPLARRILLKALPSRLDPTRGWGVPTVSRGCRR